MCLKFILCLSLSCLAVGLALAAPQSADAPASLADFQKRAAGFHSIISLPQLETTTNEIAAAVRQTIAAGKFTSQAIHAT
jgi:hypothetical protein